MKLNSTVSFIFGLLMLTAITNQILGNTIRLSLGDGTIELSEILEDLDQEDGEDEEEEIEHKLLTLTSIQNQSIEIIAQQYMLKSIDSTFFHSILIKIPVPPPEFA